MLDSNKFMEKFLQKRRFVKAIPFVSGSVLDFGGNRGELSHALKSQNYFLCNKDYSILKGKKFDTIVMLAVIEHIAVCKIYRTLKMLKKHLKFNGRIIITTPTPSSKFILETMALFGLIDKENLAEHKHYWNTKELYALAGEVGMNVESYATFEFGTNQIIVLA